MSEVIRYVDTDASGTGTGVDWTNAYTSLSAWEAAENTDLVSDGDWHHVWCRASSGSADTTAVTINGFTTDSTHYVLIEAASGDEALKDSLDTARYRLDIASGTCLTIWDNDIRLKSLQIMPTGSGWGISYANIGGTNDLRIDSCRISGEDGSERGIVNPDGDATIKIFNTIVEKMGSRGIFLDNGGDAEVYNCIIEGAGVDGIEIQSGSDLICKNTAVFNSGTADFDIDAGATSTIDYVASDDGDGTNSVSPSGSDWDNEYTDPSTGDFTLINTGNCYHGGASGPDTGLYTTDMEGDAYNSGAYSIGVDEIVSGGTTHQLSGSINSASQLTGLLNLTQRLSGSLNSSSSTSGVLRLIQRLNGSLNSSSVVTGKIRLIHGLRGAVNSISALVGNLRLVQRLSGSIESHSHLTGNLSAPTTHSLSGSIESHSHLSGTLTEDKIQEIILASGTRTLSITATGNRVSEFTTSGTRTLSISTSGTKE